MINLDDIKVAGAAGAGLFGDWLLNLDLLLSVILTGASVIYVTMKIIGKLDKKE